MLTLRASRVPAAICILTWAYVSERVTRIELALSAWEADVLPLNYTREVAAVCPARGKRARRRDLPRHRTGCYALGWPRQDGR
jgi:hypothetical protein